MRTGGPARPGTASVTAPLEPARAVVAVGGNALTAADQLGTWVEIESNAAETASSLASLVRAGWQVAVVHGNGPQVGNLAMQQDALAEIVPAQPLHQLCAMTQRQLGSVLVRAIDRECGPGVAACVVTHVGVDPQDPAFDHPTKPIGPFFDRERAEQLARERGWQVVEDSGRGYRRVVGSPQPVQIVEMDAVRTLLQAGHVVLAAGGVAWRWASARTAR
jgi:carbamate kinase